MAKVGVQIDGTMVLVGAALVGVAYVYYKRKEIAQVATVGLNPTHRENYVNQAAQNIVGSERLQTGFDHLFGYWDLINPWAPDYRKDYAQNVWAETLGLK